MLNHYYRIMRPHLTAKGLNGTAARYVHALTQRLVPAIRERHRLECLVGPWGYWDAIQTYQISFLVKMGLTPDHYLLDIGCGPLLGGMPLIQYLKSGHYTGVDIRENAVIEAIRQVIKSGLYRKNPMIVYSDSFGRNELNGRTFDYVWASQILYHLDDAGVEELFTHLAQLIRKHGKFFCDIIGYPNKVRETSSWNGFTFHLHTKNDLERTAGRHGFSMRHIGQIEQYGYPSEVSLKTNDMLEFRKLM